MVDYFFDTTVLVAYFKEEDSHTLRMFDTILDGDATACVSAVTVAEVVAASDINDPVLRPKRLAVLNLLDVMTIDRAIAERGGELRRQHNLALPDALIAACAERAGGRFLSKDPHFNRLIKANILDGQIYSISDSTGNE